MIAWCRRDTARPQVHGDFHILDVADDREINGFAPERTTYHLDGLDRFEIDQARYCKAFEARIRVTIAFQSAL
jgi:hypothetical protein